MVNNEVKNENKMTLAEEMAMQNAYPFTKIFISHCKGVWEKTQTPFNFIQVAEVNRYGSGEVVRLNVTDAISELADHLRLGDIIKCYISFDGLSSTSEKEVLAIEKLFDSQLPLPKTR